MLNTIKIGRTTYKLHDTSSIFAHHAKCTGKHRKVKPKAEKPRQYPAYGAGMSTADYVAQYQSLNHKLKINAWDWQPLSEHVSQPQGEDIFEVDA